MTPQIKTDAAALLACVAELLSEPTRWTKGAAARTVGNAQCTPEASNAVCWCLTGAVERCGYPTGTARNVALSALSAAILLRNGLEPDSGLHSRPVARLQFWNDSALRWHGEVVAVIAEARSRLTAETG